MMNNRIVVYVIYGIFLSMLYIIFGFEISVITSLSLIVSEQIYLQIKNKKL